MGNSPSQPRSNTPTSSPQSPVSASGSHGAPTFHSVRREPRRRESIQALSNVKATAAPPSASLETAHSSTLRPSSRGRAQTAAATTIPPSLHNLALRERPVKDTMGNDNSRDIPPRAPSPSQHEAPSSKPVDVPAPANDSHPRYDVISSEPAVSSAEAYYVPPSQSQFSRPPRLPLPIEEEVHTPGSPIISPADFTTPLDPIDIDGIIPRRTSVLSNTTVDDDDVGDGLTGLEGEPDQQAVPTLIEWIGEGEKVYVTGTFAAWDRKYRLHRGGPSPHKDALSAIIHLNPGTHHLKFIVDGDMRLSDNLPTAVDFTNILVNYIEVSPDDLPQAEDAVTPAAELPEPTPVTELKAPDGIYPPQVLPPESETQLSEPKSPLPPVSEPHPPSQAVPVAPSSPKHYHQIIPRYLADLDLPEDSSRQSRANTAVSNLPTPPSLPGFLGKSILNIPTPMKDDSSVLVMPNHTVLNHLSTSSIKNNVLATSATTRYKRKFLTTIMYKPTNATGG